MHWIIRVGNGMNLDILKQHKMWLFNKDANSNYKHFMNNYNIDDVIWFMVSGSKNKLIGMTKIKLIKKRELGPLINISLSDEELELVNPSNKLWNTELHFDTYFDISKINISYPACIRSPIPIFKIHIEHLQFFIDEYDKIIKYSNISII